MPAQVLIIGLDGATWRLFEPWAREGKLPHLAALMRAGTWGRLASTVPALTLPAWSSFMTGKNPGAHGVFGFHRLAADRYDGAGLANAADLRTERIWDVAARAGRRVGVVNVPPSYPIRPITNGFIVSCMLTPPGQRFTDPPELAAELGEYEIDIPPPKNLRRTDADYRERSLAYLHGMRRQTTLRGAATRRLLEQRQLDAFCVVFYAPDRVQHYFWEYVDPDRAPATPPDADIHAALLEVYREMDRAVGALVDAAGPDTTVVVLSDHGFGEKPMRAVRVNRWLADHGFLRRRPLWKLRRKVVRTVMPPSWRQRYDTLDTILVDRPRSRAWSQTIFTGTAGIWVHLRGRYPHGCVADGAEYERVRAEIRAGLSALRDEHGRRVFAAVAPREEVYRGPFVPEAPDLVATCEPEFGVVFESLRRELRQPELFGPFEELGYTGTHDPWGIYLFAGRHALARGRHDDFAIEAIAPTVLHLLGVPIPRDVEAASCTSALTPEFLAANPPAFCDPVALAAPAARGGAGQDDENVAEHLRALGYLE